MFILLWLALGALAGWVASMIVGRGRMGLLANIGVGLVGSLIGGFVASLMGLGDYATFSLGGIVIAVLGATLFLAVINLITGKRMG